MILKLEHLSARLVAEAGVFDGVNDYDQLTDGILMYGDDGETEDEQKDNVGMALEVFAEFFLRRFGTPANPRLGISETAHTSMNKFQVGYDFDYKDLNGTPGHIQVKFRRNPMHKFTRDELGTFISMADEEGVPRERRLLFTNQDHQPSDQSNGVFHSSYAGGLKQMRVIDRTYQEEFIDRDPSFWSDLRASVALSAQEPDQFKAPHTLRPHQVRMHAAAVKGCTDGLSRMRFVCATGGGKTENQYRIIRWMLLENGGSLGVVVAPTIDLLRQHHAYFEQFGFFHRDGVSVVHFRTGDEARQDSWIEYAQTTTKDEFARVLANNAGKKVLIYVTYASEQKMFDCIRDFDKTADICVWDEFHHTVRQDVDYLEHLLSLPVNHNLFYSASQKRGRIVCSFNENVYGPLMEEVTYAELRQAGILVPQIIIKPIRVNPRNSRMKAIGRELKKAAARDNFNLKDAMVEAASGIVARLDLYNNYGRANIVTFSKGVKLCKAITNSETVRAEMAGCLTQTVHHEIPARMRKSIYDQIKESDDSILHQFAVVKEGIDITPFNALIISRNMDVIGTQQGIGRVVRAHPQDTANLAAGKISLDSPEGWLKYSAVVYVIIHDDEMEKFSSFIRTFIDKLQFSGFEMDDYRFDEISAETYVGLGDKNDGDVPIINTSELFETESLREYVAALQIEMEEEEQYSRLVDSIDNVDSLRAALLQFAV